MIGVRPYTAAARSSFCEQHKVKYPRQAIAEGKASIEDWSDSLNAHRTEFGGSSKNTTPKRQAYMR